MDRGRFDESRAPWRVEPARRTAAVCWAAPWRRSPGSSSAAGRRGGRHTHMSGRSGLSARHRLRLPHDGATTGRQGLRRVPRGPDPVRRRLRRLQTDRDNCGGCGDVCRPRHACESARCQNGACRYEAVACPPPGECQSGSGVCDPATGLCGYAPRTGEACGPAADCAAGIQTTQGACSANGACQPGIPTVCAPYACDDDGLAVPDHLPLRCRLPAGLPLRRRRRRRPLRRGRRTRAAVRRGERLPGRAALRRGRLLR